MLWRQSERGEIVRVWACRQKAYLIYWEDDEDGAIDRRRKAKEEF